jgi:uncharacterized membrane protein YqaE (UPF0057 family)
VKFALCILLPPLAVLLAGKPFAALINIPLTFLGWIPGVVHAFFVVNNAEAEKRHRAMIDAMGKRG